MLLPIFLYTYNLTRGDYETWSFCYGVNEVFALLGHYAMVIGSCLALEDGANGLSQSITNYHSTQRKIPEEHRSLDNVFKYGYEICGMRQTM